MIFWRQKWKRVLLQVVASVRLWSFFFVGTKLVRFLTKNNHSWRNLLYFVNMSTKKECYFKNNFTTFCGWRWHFLVEQKTFLLWEVWHVKWITVGWHLLIATVIWNWEFHLENERGFHWCVLNKLKSSCPKFPHPEEYVNKKSLELNNRQTLHHVKVKIICFYDLNVDSKKIDFKNL